MRNNLLLNLIKKTIINIFKYVFHKEIIVLPLKTKRKLIDEDFKDIFTRIYKKNIWGGKKGEFYSGEGSHDPDLIDEYIALLRCIIQYNNITSICDFGCGDFNIMEKVVTDKIMYYGIDVVEELINHNNDIFGKKNINFKAADIVNVDANDLPEAEMLIVRQTLQHLDNKSIIILLEKFKKYRYILITEHIHCRPHIKYNIDKECGDDIRRSGIKIEDEPFNLKNTVVLLMLESWPDTYFRTTLTINY
jgi:2-polyprenyl-3-methyl-5-hydroxy-6-metoxy-1,4-benzoquinol methylase